MTGRCVLLIPCNWRRGRTSRCGSTEKKSTAHGRQFTVRGKKDRTQRAHRAEAERRKCFKKLRAPRQTGLQIQRFVKFGFQNHRLVLVAGGRKKDAVIHGDEACEKRRVV